VSTPKSFKLRAREILKEITQEPKPIKNLNFDHNINENKENIKLRDTSSPSPKKIPKLSNQKISKVVRFGNVNVLSKSQNVTKELDPKKLSDTLQLSNGSRIDLPKNQTISEAVRYEHSKTPSKIIKGLSSIRSELKEPFFHFKMSRQALKRNYKILKENKFDLEKVLNFHPNSITSYGSEFKDTFHLKDLLSKHPRWEKMNHHLNHGVSFPVRELR